MCEKFNLENFQKELPFATLQEVRQWIYLKKMEKLQQLRLQKQMKRRRLSTIIEYDENNSEDFAWKEQSLQCFNFEYLDDIEGQTGGDSEVQLPEENEYKFIDSKIKK